MKNDTTMNSNDTLCDKEVPGDGLESGPLASTPNKYSVWRLTSQNAGDCSRHDIYKDGLASAKAEYRVTVDCIGNQCFDDRNA